MKIIYFYYLLLGLIFGVALTEDIDSFNIASSFLQDFTPTLLLNRSF